MARMFFLRDEEKIHKAVFAGNGYGDMGLQGMQEKEEIGLWVSPV